MNSKEDALANRELYPPGSPEAVERGCTCSVEENAEGIGHWSHGWTWLINHECPLHWWESNYWNGSTPEPKAAPVKMVFKLRRRK